MCHVCECTREKERERERERKRERERERVCKRKIESVGMFMSLCFLTEKKYLVFCCVCC